MIRTYSSVFASFIEALIEQKHALGYTYDESMRILSNFDKFCTEYFPTERELSKSLCMAWAVRKDTEGNNGFRNRLMPVRELARYMNRIGIKAFVIPVKLAKKGARYAPHIYTGEELRIFFEVLDDIPSKRNFPIRHLVIPTIFRVIYCCGLRPSEARKLRMENIELLTGKIRILESKGHKDRIVMLSNDVLELCRKYNEKVSCIMPGREWFFPDSDGNLYTKKWFEKTFRVQWSKTNIPQFGENAPRIYDFRHTFATHRLYQWMREGKDLTAMLPYLSAYMGHAQLSDTYYYIHLVPEFFETVSSVDIQRFEKLLPEVESWN